MATDTFFQVHFIQMVLYAHNVCLNTGSTPCQSQQPASTSNELIEQQRKDQVKSSFQHLQHAEETCAVRHTWWDVICCSLSNCSLAARSLLFSFMSSFTRTAKTSHSACFLRRDLRADSRLDCFLLCLFTSLSSCNTSKLAAFCDNTTCFETSAESMLEECQDKVTDLQPARISPLHVLLRV